MCVTHLGLPRDELSKYFQAHRDRGESCVAIAKRYGYSPSYVSSLTTPPRSKDNGDGVSSGAAADALAAVDRSSDAATNADEPDGPADTNYGESDESAGVGSSEPLEGRPSYSDNRGWGNDHDKLSEARVAMWDARPDLHPRKKLDARTTKLRRRLSDRYAVATDAVREVENEFERIKDIKAALEQEAEKMRQAGFDLVDGRFVDGPNRDEIIKQMDVTEVFEDLVESGLLSVDRVNQQRQQTEKQIKQREREARRNEKRADKRRDKALAAIRRHELEQAIEETHDRLGDVIRLCEKERHGRKPVGAALSDSERAAARKDAERRLERVRKLQREELRTRRPHRRLRSPAWGEVRSPGRADVPLAKHRSIGGGPQDVQHTVRSSVVGEIYQRAGLGVYSEVELDRAHHTPNWADLTWDRSYSTYPLARLPDDL